MRRPVSTTNDLDVVASDEGALLQSGSTQEQVAQIKKKSVSGAISYALRTIVLYGISVGASFLLAAFLKPAQFGIYGIVVSITSFFTIISDIGLAASLIQKDRQPTLLELRTVFTVQQMLAWTVCLLVVGTAGLFYHQGKIGMDGIFLAGAFALSFPIVSLKTISSILLERDLAFDRLVIPAVVEAIAFNSIAVVLAWRGFGLTSYTVAVLVRSILGVATMFFIKRWDMGLAFSKAAFMDLMKVGAKFQLNDMLAKAKDELFFLGIALFLPAGDLGLISWATRFSKMPYSFTVDSVMAVTFPTFSRLQDDRVLLRKAIEKTLFFISAVAFPTLAGFAVMMFPLTTLIPKYEQWKSALPLLCLMSAGLMWSAISTPLINTLNAIGKISISLRLMVLWTFLQWTITPFAIWKFGFVGVGIASFVISCTSAFVVFIAWREIRFGFFDQVWRQVLATGVMCATLYTYRLFWARSFEHLIAGVVLGGVLYTGLMLLTGFEKLRTEVASLRG